MADPRFLTLRRMIPPRIRASLRLALRNARALMHPSHPPVLLTSVPKAGTHLLTSLLHRLGYTLYANQPFNPNVIVDYNPAEFRPHLQRVLRGEYILEHLTWKKETEEIMRALNMKVLFVYRDPRATAVSFAHYLAEMNSTHRLSAYFRSLPGTDERVMATLKGIPDYESSNGFGRAPLAALYDNFLPWKNSTAAYSMAFEDLVGERGGGSRNRQFEAIAGVIRYLGLGMDERKLGRIASGVFNEKSMTFRSAQCDSWRRDIRDEIAAAMDRDLARQLREWGYR